MECPICIEAIESDKVISCKNEKCNFKCCIDCCQKYLLNSAQSEHCMSCRYEMLFTDFVTKFPVKWRLNVYKEHCKDILWAKERPKINETQNYLAQNNGRVSKLNRPTVKKANYTYKCPNNLCNGSLNEKYECTMCVSNYCGDCFEKITLMDPHTCDKEKCETVTQIKKEAKPCPSCGEMISKHSGCDQIFCVSCGTGFSWRTGIIEKGIIHNPHAARYFADNPEAREKYLERTRNGNNNVDNREVDETETLRFNMLIHLDELEVDPELKEVFILICRSIYNFRNIYEFPKDIDNIDIRVKWLKKEIDDKKAKVTLHQRYKKTQKNKMDYEILSTYFTIITELIKDVAKSNSAMQVNELWYNDFFEVISYTNTSLKNIGEYFNLQPLTINENFEVVKVKKVIET